MLDTSGQGLRVRDGFKIQLLPTIMAGLCQFRWSLADGSCFKVVLCGRAVIPGHSSPLGTQIMTTRHWSRWHMQRRLNIGLAGGSSSLPYITKYLFWALDPMMRIRNPNQRDTYPELWIPSKGSLGIPPKRGLGLGAHPTPVKETTDLSIVSTERQEKGSTNRTVDR